jgi:PIN domain nuclease of toxin-antitoxin system
MSWLLDTNAWIDRDPFDRMLVAQALADNLTLVSADTSLDAYGVQRLW